MTLLTAGGSVDIHYESAGGGPPVVFVHGWSLSGFVWSGLTESLSGRFTCVRMDLRGHGRSSSPDTGYGMEELASDLAALFERLQLTGAALAGWSMGSLVALAAFPEIKERLSALVLVSGTPKFTSSDGYPHGLHAREPRGLSLRLKRNYDASLDDFFRAMFTPAEIAGGSFERFAEEIAPFMGRPSRNAALRSLDALAGADMRQMLTGIRIPVLLVHGEEDTICLPGASRYMADRIPGASLALMKGTGHAPMLSRAEELGCIIAGFLERIYGID